MKERLIRVERFDELRAGMIVVVNPCALCGGGSHRAMLVTFVPRALAYRASGAGEVGDIWRIAPRPFGCLITAVGASSVRAGVVFRVDDGLDLAFETAEQKRKPVRT